MSIKRRQRRASQIHFAFLADQLGRFYEFLSKMPQPSDEEVRSEFKQREHCWKQYCAKKQLSKTAYSLFNEQVAQLWRKKQTQQPGSTGK